MADERTRLAGRNRIVYRDTPLASAEGDFVPEPRPIDPRIAADVARAPDRAVAPALAARARSVPPTTYLAAAAAAVLVARSSVTPLPNPLPIRCAVSQR